MTGPIVVLAGVSKRYGSNEALRPLDLELHLGVTGLLGPNGAGKSTLLRLLATAQLPTTGSITVGGHELTASLAQRTAARRLLGYLPQQVTFPRRMTAFGFLDYIAVLKEWRSTDARHAEVRRVLESVDLGHLGAKRVSALSGGQQRRLAIAQGLIGTPSLVILDEPTTGLDPEQRASLRALLSEQARSAAVLVATHQTEDVAALCDRVIVIDTGAVRFDGSVGDLLATAADQVWEASEPAEDAVASWRTGVGEVRSVGGVPVRGARPVAPSVEDAYLLLRAGTRFSEGAPR